MLSLIPARVSEKELIQASETCILYTAFKFLLDSDAFLYVAQWRCFRWDLTEKPMKVAVYDTYVRKKGGSTMHFDVVVPDGTPQEKALEFANQYLESVGQRGQPCGAQECQ